MKGYFFSLIFITSCAFGQINPQNVTIARDQWGVPHIFAKTDPEVAYGLAYAHAEDDFATIQQTMIAAQGQLGVAYGIDAANDFDPIVEDIYDYCEAQELDEAKQALVDELGAPAIAFPKQGPRPQPARGAITPESLAQTVAALLPENAIVSDEGLTFGYLCSSAAQAAAPQRLANPYGGSHWRWPPHGHGSSHC